MVNKALVNKALVDKAPVALFQAHPHRCDLHERDARRERVPVQLGKHRVRDRIGIRTHAQVARGTRRQVDTEPVAVTPHGQVPARGQLSQGAEMVRMLRAQEHAAAAGGHQPFDGAVVGQPAALHDDDPVADLLHFGQQV